MNNLIDLSHTLEESMPVYPGTEQPQFIPNCTIANQGFNEKSLKFQTHTGTHIDAPFHIFEEGKNLTNYTINKFYGKGVVLDLADLNIMSENGFSHLDKKLIHADFILLRTGWDKHWHSARYFEDFLTPSIELIQYLVQFNINGIGIDAISVDPMNSRNLPNHRLILSNDIIIVENLKNLELISQAEFEFFCFPLPIKEGDGSPTRAVARLI